MLNQIEEELRYYLEQHLNESFSSLVKIKPRFLASMFMREFFNNYYIYIYDKEETRKSLNSALADAVKDIKELRANKEDPGEDIKYSLKFATGDNFFDFEVYQDTLKCLNSISEIKLIIKDFVDDYEKLAILFVFMVENK